MYRQSEMLYLRKRGACVTAAEAVSCPRVAWGDEAEPCCAVRCHSARLQGHRLLAVTRRTVQSRAKFLAHTDNPHPCYLLNGTNGGIQLPQNHFLCLLRTSCLVKREEHFQITVIRLQADELHIAAPHARRVTQRPGEISPMLADELFRRDGVQAEAHEVSESRGGAHVHSDARPRCEATVCYSDVERVATGVQGTQRHESAVGRRDREEGGVVRRGGVRADAVGEGIVHILISRMDFSQHSTSGVLGGRCGDENIELEDDRRVDALFDQANEHHGRGGERRPAGVRHLKRRDGSRVHDSESPLSHLQGK